MSTIKCLVCMDNLAIMQFVRCKHRVCCAGCTRTLRQQGSSCPLCCEAIEEVKSSENEQLEGTTSIEFAVELADELRLTYPFGARLLGEERLARAELLNCVREAIAAVKAFQLSLTDFRRLLLRTLTGEQVQLVYIELIKDHDLHDVLRKVNSRQFEKTSAYAQVQDAIVHTVESKDTTAIVARAVVSSVGDTVFDGIIGGANGLAGFSVAVDGISNLVMFTVFASLEVYRWSRGELTGAKAARNVGEHAVGAGSGFAGAMAGFKVGVIVGGVVGTCVVPGAGTLLGCIVGGIIFMFFGGVLCEFGGRWVYRRCFSKVAAIMREEPHQEDVPLTPQEIAQKAADKLGVTLNLHSFEEANTRFRKALLAHHPDKFPNATPQRKQELAEETRDILSAWVVLREYYKDSNRIDDEDNEAFIHVMVLKRRISESATEKWEFVKTWIEGWMQPAPEHDVDVDGADYKVEKLTLYV